MHTILSGPAGGVVGALKVARALGIDHIITLDMGGTSTDVSLVPGAPRVTTESEIEGSHPRPRDRHSHGGRGRWLHRLARRRRGAAGRPGERGGGSRSRMLREGRRALDGDRRQRPLGPPPRDWFLGGRMQLDLDAARGGLPAPCGSSRREPGRYGLQRLASGRLQHGTGDQGHLRREGVRSPRLLPGLLRRRRGVHACELAAKPFHPQGAGAPLPGSAFGPWDGRLGCGEELCSGPPRPSGRSQAPARKRDGKKTRGAGCGRSPTRGGRSRRRGDPVLLDLRYQRQSFELTLPAPQLADERIGPGDLCRSSPPPFTKRTRRPTVTPIPAKGSNWWPCVSGPKAGSSGAFRRR